MDTKLMAKRTFIQAVIITLVVLVAWMLVSSSQIVITGLSGIFIAVIFCGSANWLSKKTGISSKIWLPFTIFVPFLLFSLFLLYTAPKVTAQASELIERVPQAISYLEEVISKFQWPDKLNSNMDKISSYDPEVNTIVSVVSNFFTSTMNALGSLIFALFLALFISVNPSWYIKGASKLVPPTHRNRFHEVLEECGTALLNWFVAKISSMIIVGVFTTIGLWALGIDLALILGIIAGLLSFIPNLGPIIAFIPAAMVSMIAGVDALIYVSILYLAVQIVESYLITPILQAEIASLPPALTLFVQVLLGGMIGVLGIILAAPITVLIMVIIKMLYVEDILKDKTEVKP